MMNDDDDGGDGGGGGGGGAFRVKNHMMSLSSPPNTC